ncbi:hypothetical protein [Paraclostridium sordellii]|uniref:hypothetical protein n=1 Tax=Paraclostridium sordellii TaxID=1505 RepID=UPI0022E6BB73|nr:hypothetical protein [Paeniclostridium sordellii]
MKIKLIWCLLCMSIVLTGCSNKNFDNAVNQGNEALANKEYTKAEASFRLALAQKNDDEIFKLNEQTNKIIQILRYIEDNDFEKALKTYNEIEKDGFANDLIKNDIKEIKKEIDKLQKNQNESKEEVKSKDDKMEKKQGENENIKKDPIEKAKEAIYSARELSSKKVKLKYYPSSELGTIISNDIKNKYYVFGIENLADNTNWDSYLIVNKNSYEVLDMDMYGNIQGIQQNNMATETNYGRVEVSSNQIEGGISAEKALNIIETAYASRFVYTGEHGLNGIISDEIIYNPNTGLEGYAYLFAFREKATGLEYIGEVYKDGEYRLLCSES